MLKPGSATQPFPGIGAEIRNERGDVVDGGGTRFALTRPWPAMLRGTYGDPPTPKCSGEQVGTG